MINWDNKPALGSLAGIVPMNATAAYYELDVTDYVAGEVAGDGMVSFMLQENAGKYTTLNSRKKGVDGPELVIIGSSTNAMKSAVPGDIINIAPGTYTGVRSTSSISDPWQGLEGMGKSAQRLHCSGL